MPHTMSQLEEPFEPVVEWFQGLAAASVQTPASAALEERSPLEAAAMVFIP